MWELDCKEIWVPKNWCFWTVVLENTLQSPLECKEIQPVHLKGNQSWIFGHLMWRTDSFEKTLMLGKIEGRRRRGQHRMRWLDGITDLMDIECKYAPGVGDGQGSLTCCSPWGHRVGTNWVAELNGYYFNSWLVWKAMGSAWKAAQGFKRTVLTVKPQAVMGQENITSQGPLKNPAHWRNVVQDDSEGRGLSKFYRVTPWVLFLELRDGWVGRFLHQGSLGSPWFSQTVFLSPRNFWKEGGDGRREKSGRRLERPGLRTPGIYMGKEINSLSSLCWQDKLGHVAPKKGLRSHLCSSQPSQHASQYVNVWPAQTQKPPPEILVGFLRMPRRQWNPSFSPCG